MAQGEVSVVAKCIVFVSANRDIACPRCGLPPPRQRVLEESKSEFPRRIPGPVEHVVVDDRHHVSHFWCMFYIEHQVRPNKSFLVMIREKDEVLDVIV